MKNLVLILLSGLFTLVSHATLIKDSHPFLDQENDFNKVVYAIYSENVKNLRKGGFSHAEFELVNATHTEDQALAALISEGKVPASQLPCRRGDANKCAQLIINKDISVQPKTKLPGVFAQIEIFKSWNMSDRWNAELGRLELLIKEHLGNDFSEYVVGYEDNKDIFNYILVSKDQTKAIVLSGNLKLEKK